MQFLHDSELHTNRILKSLNCVARSRWSLQVADFWLYKLRQNIYVTDNEYAPYRSKDSSSIHFLFFVFNKNEFHFWCFAL